MNAMKYKHQLTIGLSCLVVLASSVTTSAQNVAPTQGGCVRLEQSRPALFISYESSSDSGVRLHLHNNSNCPVIVETDDSEPVLSGGLKSIPLHYLLQDRRRQTAKPAYGWGDSVFTVEVPGADSVAFLVSAEHFKKRLDVAVPFTYAWEGKQVGAGSIGGVNHYVYFLADDLPEEALRQKYRQRTRHNNSLEGTLDCVLLKCPPKDKSG